MYHFCIFIASSSMEMSLINEYPKLFKTFQDFITRLSSSLTSVPDAQEQMIKAIQPFEKAYINVILIIILY